MSEYVETAQLLYGTSDNIVFIVIMHVNFCLLSIINNTVDDKAKGYLANQ